MNPADDRYQVVDQACGLISSMARRADAEKAVLAAQYQHSTCKVELFDLMAHRGRADTWDAWGAATHFRAADGC